MQRKAEDEDPYELIRRLRGVIQNQREAIEEYQLICDSLFHEKTAISKEASELRKQVSILTRQLESEKSKKKGILTE